MDLRRFDKRSIITGIMESRGITESMAAAYGYAGKVEQMKTEKVYDILSYELWDSLNTDDIIPFSPTLAFELVKTAIYKGREETVSLLQHCINELDYSGEWTNQLSITGIMDNVTASALRDNIIHNKNGDVLAEMVAHKRDKWWPNEIV